MKGWKGARDKASVSNLARKRLAYEGAILVPIAVPLWLFGYLMIFVKTFHFFPFFVKINIEKIFANVLDG